jgi:hypothetical protein
MEFRVDNDSVVEFANRLELIKKSHFPSAVKSTLNDLAFDVKLKTMPNVVEKTFINRDKNFFRAMSMVDMAKGSEVNSMVSKVGFISNRKNQAVDNLEQQERGGKIEGRSFIAMDAGRVSGSNKRVVSKRNQITKIKNIVNVSDSRAKTDGQKFIQSVQYAGKGGHILNKDTLFRVDNLSKLGNRWKFKLKAIHSFKKGRSVSVKSTHFMEKATKQSSVKGDDFFKKQAEKRFSK